MAGVKRILVASDLPAAPTDEFVLGGSAVHHVRNVMRMRVGQALSLCDGKGHIALATISEISTSTIRLRIDERTSPTARPHTLITLIYGLARSGPTETVIQKATELGVDRIVLTVCERSVARPKDELKKQLRWQRIADEAVRQSERVHGVTVALTPSLTEAIGQCAAQTLLVGDPQAAVSLGAVAASIAESASLGLLIGPEGGLSPSELQQAQDSGFLAVRLASAVLRTETAAIAGLAQLSYLTANSDLSD